MNDEIKDFTNTLLICDEITNQICILDIRNFESVNELTNSFMNIFDKEKKKLPYHINILDLIWANENAHSRILAELLRQNSENKYDVLESFLNYLTKINQKLTQKPINPRITSEKERIDLLILDKEFALIIENKIHDAVDQSSQLARYIEKIKSKGIKESEIYVLYLTRDGSKIPESQSWINDNGIDYQDIFLERFFPISFRDNILPWLKDYILPNCRIKDVYLKSTIEQYIDYLEGIFNSRQINKEMNKELENHIIKVLDLTSTPEKNHSTINKKIEELNKVKDQLDNLKQLSEKECWRKWAENLKRDFPNFKIFDKSDIKEFPKVGVSFENNGKHFSVLIESKINGTIYYGIGRHYSSEVILEDVRKFVKPLIEGFGEDKWWYGWKYTSFENGYSRLKSLIEEVTQLNNEVKL